MAKCEDSAIIDDNKGKWREQIEGSEEERSKNRIEYSQNNPYGTARRVRNAVTVERKTV